MSAAWSHCLAYLMGVISTVTVLTFIGALMGRADRKAAAAADHAERLARVEAEIARVASRLQG